jgi:hypothetical protein
VVVIAADIGTHGEPAALNTTTRHKKPISRASPITFLAFLLLSSPSSSSSSSYNNNSYRYRNNYHGGSSSGSGGFLIGTIIFLALLLLLCACMFFLASHSRKSLARSFQKAVDEHREVVGRKCAGDDGDVAGNTIQQHDNYENKNQDQCNPPYSTTIFGSPPATADLVATYVASYQEGGKLCNTHTNMVFTSLRPTGGRGFAIDGSGSDSDGTFDIIEGLIAPDGQAYWIEQQGSRQILSTGVFTNTAKTTNSMGVYGGIDEHAGTVSAFFKGQWQSSNGFAASYVSYALDKTHHHHQQQQQQQQQHAAVVTTATTPTTTAITTHHEHAFDCHFSDAAAVGVAQQYRPTYY